MISHGSLAAMILAASGLAFLSGCPDDKANAPAPPPAANSTPARPDGPAPTARPEPPQPRTGWRAVAVGSSFETVTKSHLDNPEIPDTERRTVQTVLGFDPDGVRVRVACSGGGVDDPAQEVKYPWKGDEKDPGAQRPATTHETLTVSGKSYDCEVTTETSDGSTTRTWRNEALPLPLKIEVKGGGVQSTSELVKADLK